MARDVPSPCCGSFAVDIREQVETIREESESRWSESTETKQTVLYSCHCGNCGVQYGDKADSRSEALYNYDQKCFAIWRKNPNGLQSWMLKKPVSKKELLKRQLIWEQLRRGFSALYG